MLVFYRVVYGIILGVFLGNIVMAVKGHTAAPEALLLVAAGLLLCAIVALLVAFRRVQPMIFWVLVLGWEVLFVWYAWFGPVAPFVFHEAHTLDATALARESAIHNVKAGVLFAALSAWFLSLPFARITLRPTPRSS